MKGLWIMGKGIMSQDTGHIIFTPQSQHRMIMSLVILCHAVYFVCYIISGDMLSYRLVQ